jgi:competence protein ComEC
LGLARALETPHGVMNPNGFDTELWFFEQGVGATGYVRATPKDPAPRRVSDAPALSHVIERMRMSVKDAIWQQLGAQSLRDRAEQSDSATTSNPAGVVSALVMGDQRAIDRADWDVFRQTGVAHLMSISGLHVTLFAAVAWWAFMALWRLAAGITHNQSSRFARAVRAIPAAWVASGWAIMAASAYALFSGWGVPAQRTVYMLALFMLLRQLGRNWPWPHSLLAAALLVALIDPWALLSAGFWLSFVAVAILFGAGFDVLATPKNIATEPNYLLGKGRFFIEKSALGKLLVQQVQLSWALAPLALIFFQQVSVVGLLANIIAVPWVTWVITPLAMLGVVWPALWHLAAWAVQLLGLVLQWFAAFPLATVDMAAVPWALGAIAVAGAALAVANLPWRVRAAALSCSLGLLLWSPARPAQGEFELWAADIGQGNAVLVRTREHSLLFDAGPQYNIDSDAGHRIVVPWLRAMGERIDVLMISHSDADHIGGAKAVLQAQSQALLSSSIAVDHPLRGITEKSSRCQAGHSWVWNNVSFEVLHPSPADYAVVQKPNAMSCVLRVTSASGQSALLTGDIESAQEAALVEKAADKLKAQVVLVPHHGSKTSSTDSFIDAVHSKFAVVQSGYKNRFGHPAPVVAQRYVDRGIQLIESPACGAGRFLSSEPETWRCTRGTPWRYWQHRVLAP